MQQRLDKRFARRLHVEFRKEGERPRIGYTVNVSPVGMFVATPRPPEPGARLSVRVKLPDRSLELEAEVKHAVRASPILDKVRQEGMGLRFLERQDPELLPGHGAGSGGASTAAGAAGGDSPAAGSLVTSDGARSGFLATPPFEIRLKLEGWALFWADLELTGEGDRRLAALLERITSEIRAARQLASLATDPTVAALRRLFRAAGCDPTRYRPSSEALLRRVLKGGDPPAIHPLVDLNNCLSLRLAVPCCVTAEGVIEPPLVFRSGRPGESYESLRGPFNLEGKPLLADAAGPLDAPITGSRRGMVRPETKAAWLTAYLPAEALGAEAALAELEALLAAAPVARLRRAAVA